MGSVIFSTLAAPMHCRIVADASTMRRDPPAPPTFPPSGRPPMVFTKTSRGSFCPPRSETNHRAR
eukprot:8582088-Pyramimonas_sp.AAC.1